MKFVDDASLEGDAKIFEDKEIIQGELKGLKT